MSIELLPQRLIEEGQDHPFVRELCKELRKDLRHLEVTLRDSMASGMTTADSCRVTAGRAVQLRDVLLKIDKATGKDEEE